MSSNVGLTTPRGSGTSGYVQRNSAFMKPRDRGYGAPYPPVSGANGDFDRPFKQRQPDKQILEHDRRRAIEVKVMEERERLEEENERVEEEMEKSHHHNKGKKAAGGGGDEKEEGEEKEGPRVLSEEEIDERCEVLRAKLVKEMEVEDELRKKGGGAGGAGGRGEQRGAGGRGMPPPPRERRQFKSYQVHELAEAKIEESERLRRALGIKEDRETGELSSGRGSSRRDQDRERERERSRS